MEDRHYLSEPRPISGLALPTWEVDVMREGVNVPIMTLQINSQVLPPRQRKKKVVWKLPDTIDQAPKFGKEDKLRILELFKQQKKTLKREKRKSQPNDDSEKNDGTTGGEDLNPSSNGFPDSSSDDSSANDCNKATTNGTLTATESSSSSKPPGFESLSIDDKRHTTVAHHYLTKKKGTNRNSDLKDNPLPANPPPPPGLNTEVSAPLSPPGLAPLSSSTPSLPPGIPPTASTTPKNPPEQAQPLDQQPLQPSPLAASLPEYVPRYFHVSAQSPNPPAVELAQIVTQAYYFMLTHGHVQELQAHYSPSATKSLTVGGAHAVCASMQDIALQLQSLVGTMVAIRGVLHQTIPNPTSSSPHSALDSVLVIITGMSIRPHSLPFCHTLVLAPNLAGGGYQIQNDALCFLTTEAIGGGGGGGGV